VSSIEIQEHFEVDAEPSAVFGLLVHPQRIVDCLPGAQLEQVESERAFLGNVKVKVGTVTILYRGRIELTEVDPVARRVRAVGEGREKGGAGKVKLSLAGHVESSSSGSRVRVEANVQLAGRIVRFGRGLIDAVAKQIFREFAEAVQSRFPGGGEPVASSSAPASSASDSDGTVRPLAALPLLLRALWIWLRDRLRRSGL
jgi:carbon monoxide dehydrogenase subunit G